VFGLIKIVVFNFIEFLFVFTLDIIEFVLFLHVGFLILFYLLWNWAVIKCLRKCLNRKMNDIV